ncbi:RNA polymerase sigma factor [Motilibacter aurantiacus]|uniref:RNA polymerase sigma factor n=1 Tax=Motilibacter aurantiacus TaxID=2714955 RepID=UPI00140A3687|nr:SigE family RNA polymerase sigma factor [Motilibacter aurantiacus]
MTAEGGFDEFVAAASPRLVQHLSLALGDPSRAQDCAQEAFVRAWQRWARLTAEGSDPYAWVRTVAWRLAVSDWRKAAAHLRALVRHGPALDVAEPLPDGVAIRDALARLPVDQRVALVLHYFADLPVREIADVLRVPEGTVKARLSRGRKALAGLLSELEEAR